MNRFSIVAKKDKKSVDAEMRIKDALCAKGFSYDKANPELVISVGGDGTLLYAVHTYIDKLDKVLFVAVHTGTLGFFTDYTEDNIDTCVDDIVNGEIYEIFESRLIQAEIYKKEEIKKIYALNEIRIENVCQTQTLDIYIDNEYFETVKGNGMCLSTQAGATAYNRALKGAVVDNGLSIMQLVEIAGIHDSKHGSLGVPYIMKCDRCVTFNTHNTDDAYLCYDYMNLRLQDVQKICCKLSNKSVKFARFKEYSYLKRLRNLY
ncbi:MAG: NAD kinase [Bacilli bacterium]|nr:NAD kinase [Bacilli bacterium]